MQHFSAVNFNFSSQSSSASTVALTSGFSDVKSPRPRLSSFGFDVQESQSERRHGTCMATPERGLPRSGSISLLSKMIKDSPCVTPNSGNAGRDQDSTFSRQPNSEAINKTNAHMTSPSIPIPNETVSFAKSKREKI